MKKVFPVIVVLIVLSLAGIILFQVSWLKNLLQVQKQNIFDKVDNAGLAVTSELSKNASGSFCTCTITGSYLGCASCPTVTTSAW
jgi:two-component system phosphate regulon sensor histidine kinase PhoR